MGARLVFPARVHTISRALERDAPLGSRGFFSPEDLMFPRSDTFWKLERDSRDTIEFRKRETRISLVSLDDAGGPRPRSRRATGTRLPSARQVAIFVSLDSETTVRFQYPRFGLKDRSNDSSAFDPLDFHQNALDRNLAPLPVSTPTVKTPTRIAPVVNCAQALAQSAPLAVDALDQGGRPFSKCVSRKRRSFTAVLTKHAGTSCWPSLWTTMDFLGGAGIARVRDPERSARLDAPHPQPLVRRVTVAFWNKPTLLSFFLKRTDAALSLQRARALVYLGEKKMPPFAVRPKPCNTHTHARVFGQKPSGVAVARRSPTRKWQWKYAQRLVERFIASKPAVSLRKMRDSERWSTLLSRESTRVSRTPAPRDYSTRLELNDTGPITGHSARAYPPPTVAICRFRS